MIGRSVGDLLNEHGVTWGWFQGGFRPTTPAVGDVPAVCAASHGSSLVPAVADYIPHHEPFQYYVQTANIPHLPPTSVWHIGRTDRANHQYDLEDFYEAASRSKAAHQRFAELEYQKTKVIASKMSRALIALNETYHRPIRAQRSELKAPEFLRICSPRVLLQPGDRTVYR
jgi:hypothetical protein